MRRTLLYDWHVAQGAKMVEYAGWEMPLYYSSILQEHNAVRNAAGLFDVCHMGRLKISGSNQYELLQMTFTNDLDAMQVGQARYGVFCNTGAGVIDDAIVYRLEDGYLVVPNAVNKEAVVRHLSDTASIRGWQAHIDDLSGSLGMIALQGPKAAEMLQTVCEESLEGFTRFHLKKIYVANVECYISRTGYTGEDGFEIMPPADQVQFIWSSLFEVGQDRGLVAAGLGARDSLRIEACLPLYGHELSEDTNPLFAGLRPFIKLSKPDFIGKNSILHWTLDESTRFLVPFVMEDRAIPRQGNKIYVGTSHVGEVTSGLFSPVLNRGIGMAYIESAYMRPGTSIVVRIRDKDFRATISEKPLFKSA